MLRVSEPQAVLALVTIPSCVTPLGVPFQAHPPFSLPTAWGFWSGSRGVA